MPHLGEGKCKVLEWSGGQKIYLCRTEEGKIIFKGPRAKNELTVSETEYAKVKSELA